MGTASKLDALLGSLDRQTDIQGVRRCANKMYDYRDIQLKVHSCRLCLAVPGRQRYILGNEGLCMSC